MSQSQPSPNDFLETATTFCSMAALWDQLQPPPITRNVVEATARASVRVLGIEWAQLQSDKPNFNAMCAAIGRPEFVDAFCAGIVSVVESTAPHDPGAIKWISATDLDDELQGRAH